MTPERYEHVYEVFTQVNEAEPASRARLLDELCGNDAELRQTVEKLLAADPDAVGLDVGPGKALRSELNRQVDAQHVRGLGSPSLVGERVGHFQITGEVGQGGMGTVYAAEQDNPRRRVALKMIRSAAMSRSLLRRFQFEAEVLGRLQHPGIAQIYEAGSVDTAAGHQPYFAMEYVEGVELRKYVEEHGLPVRARMELVARICDAIHHAHQKGIVHRDLKPDNVLVVEENATTVAGSLAEFAQLGQPKVLDFGVARATDSDVQMTTVQTDVSRLVGTISYMSPEQVAGDSRKLDTRSDIYALGVILFELLAGRPPFDLRHKPMLEAARVVREEEPERLSSIRLVFRGDIETIVCKALEKERERRYQSAAEMAADIRRYLANEPISAHPPTTFYQLRKFAKRNRGLVAGLSLAFVILIAGTVSSLVFGFRASTGERLALENEAEAQRATHRLSITAAAALGEDDPVRAIELLDNVPEEYREWEWKYLHAHFASQFAEREGNGSPDLASTLACGDDGVLIAALVRGECVELVDLGTGAVRSKFEADGGLMDPSISPNGRYLAAVAEAEQMLIVWDVHSGSRILEQPVGSAGMVRTYFSSDGSCVAVGTKKEGITLLDTQTGEVFYRSMPEYVSAMPAAIDSSGTRITFNAVPLPGVKGHHVHVFSSDGERLAETNLADGCSCFAYSPDGKLLAVGQRQRVVRLLDAATLEDWAVLYGHSSPVSAVAFSHDGAYLASAAHDRSIRIWEIATGKTVRVLSGFTAKDPATSLLFSGDGSVLAAANSAGAFLWCLDRAESLVLRGHSSYVYRVAFSPDPGSPRLIASSSHLGEARVWDALSGELYAEIKTSTPYKFLGFSHDGTRFVVSCQLGSDRAREVLVWDTAAGMEVRSPRFESDEVLFESPFRPFQAVAGGVKRGGNAGENSASSPDGRFVAVVLPTNEIRISDLDNGKTVTQIGKQVERTLALAFSPDSARLVTGNDHGMIKVWDVGTGAEIASIEGHRGRVLSVNYNPEGTRIVSGADDCAVTLWDAETLEQVLVLRGHTSYVHAVCFSPDGTMLASGSGDETVRLWDSVSPAERWRQMQTARELRSEAEPEVQRLLAELGDPLDVADQLRSDNSLSGNQRRAALMVLLKGQCADVGRIVVEPRSDRN